jgi:hypothetical protein
MTFLRRLSVGLPLSRLGCRGVLGGRVAARRGRRREHQGARRAGLPEDQDDLALRSHLATIRYFLSRL